MRALKYFRALSHRLTHKPINMFISLSTNELYLQFVNHSRDNEKEVTHERITRRLSQFIDQNQNKYQDEQFYRLLATQYNTELMNEIQQFNQYLKKTFTRSDSLFLTYLQSLNQQIKHEYIKYYYLQIKYQNCNEKTNYQKKIKILKGCQKINTYNEILASKIIDMMLGNQRIKSPTNIRKSIIYLINQNSKTIPQFIIQKFLSFYDPSKLNYINNQQQKRFIDGATSFYSNTFNPTLTSCSIIQRINAPKELNLLLMGDKKIGKSFSLFHYRWLSEYLPCQGQKLKFLYFADFTEALNPLTTAKILFDQYYRDLPKYVLLFIKDIWLTYLNQQQQKNIVSNAQIKHQATKQTKFISFQSIKLQQQQMNKFIKISKMLNRVLGKKIKYQQQKKTFQFQTELTQMQTLRVLINFIRLYNKNFKTTISCFDQFNEITKKDFLQKQNNQNNVISFIRLFLSSTKTVLSSSFHIERHQNQNLFKKIFPSTQMGIDKKKQFVIYELNNENYQQINQFEREKTFNILRRLPKYQQKQLLAIKDTMQKEQQMIIKTLIGYKIPFNCQEIKNLNEGIFNQCLKISNLKIQNNKKYSLIIKQQLQKVRKNTFRSIIKQLQRWIVKQTKYSSVQEKNEVDQPKAMQKRYLIVLQLIFQKPQQYRQFSIKDLPLRIYNLQTNKVHEFIIQHKMQIFLFFQNFFESSKYYNLINLNIEKFVLTKSQVFGNYIEYYFYFFIDYFKKNIYDVFPIQNIYQDFKKESIQINFNNDNKKLAQYINSKIIHINQPYIFKTCCNQRKVDTILAIVLLEGQQQLRSIKQVQNMKQQLTLEICFVEIGLHQEQKLEKLVKQCQSGLLEGFQMQKWQQGKDNRRIYNYSSIKYRYMVACFNEKKQDKRTWLQKLNSKKNKKRKQLQKNNKKINQQQLQIQSEKELKEQQRIKEIIKQRGYVRNVQKIYFENFKKYAESYKQMYNKNNGKDSKKESK